MSLLGMPWAMINLGCEMIYILHQRLHAQGIPPDKSVKVLQDIVKTMFEPGFLTDKLFVPQDMYSLPSTRKVFDKIAHSSIMKLSENSMDKLFDLMVMGAKYCLMCSTQLDDMIQVTLRHLGTVQAILTSAMAASNPGGLIDVAVISLLSKAEQATMDFYGSLSKGELALLRHTLARYLQDKRVRVSLFLAEGIQLQSGKLVIASCLSDKVGLVRSFGTDGNLQQEEKVDAASQKVNTREFFSHPVLLGDNLYCKDRPKVVPPPRAADGGSPVNDKQETAEAAVEEEQTSHSGRYEQEQASAGSKAAAQELQFLAALINTAQPGSADNFKLTLFNDDDGAFDGLPKQNSSSKPSSKLSKPLHQELHFGSGGKNDAYIKARLGDVLEAVQLEDTGTAGSKAIGDELLDLMDNAT